jgi:histidinol dehydrogenase
MTFSPTIANWASLDEERRAAILHRPSQAYDATVQRDVAKIIADVRENGDDALRALTKKLDRCELDSLLVSGEEIAIAKSAVDASLKAAIDEAKSRIETFHRATAPQPVCDPAVLYALAACGISHVFKVGGAQAIAAMAFGTASIARCDKLFGPGNAWVTEAKRHVLMDGAAAIDLPAGPSEVLVIGDAQADADFVAADLLAQAEHGPDSQVIFISDDAGIVQRVVAALERQLADLPRAAIATSALAHARFIVAESLDQAITISNDYAPEHLILNVAEPRGLLENVRHAGSIFLGAWSPESAGDYCSGTNHVLPTYGSARAWSGVSVASFLKQITVQELTPQGLIEIGPCAATLARAERLHAHERAVTVRLDKLSEAA